MIYITLPCGGVFGLASDKKQIIPKIKKVKRRAAKVPFMVNIMLYTEITAKIYNI